jgi:hypothetical protein
VGHNELALWQWLECRWDDQRKPFEGSAGFLRDVLRLFHVEQRLKVIEMVKDCSTWNNNEEWFYKTVKDI